MTQSPSRSPYVIGQWVRGPRFYGRRALRRDILEGTQRAFWVAGLRRVGKTSLLRQLELEIRERGEHALVLDLQGIDDGVELERALDDASLETAAAAGQTWADELAQAERRFWLLVDEVDEVSPAAADLSRAFAQLIEGVLAAPNGRVVLCSSPRLIERRKLLQWLAQFDSPRALGALASDEARALVEQAQAPPTARPDLQPSAVEAICEASGGHPMLLQLVAKRSLELGDVERAIAELERDRTLEYLFVVDHELLTPHQRDLLQRVSQGQPIATDDDLRRLHEFGLLSAKGSISNRLLADWLHRRPVLS